ncbi:MAG: hypothetical protein N2509_06520 [Treponemataceae bacterium]|nr:hypothetical protein [Treponemataceae bacterium]HOK00112.1 hypothetical protein [Termitinemataceae bacterium]HOM24337.1 hypothetical protein [Termitinemataceae bacterium]HPQ01445.1 hypothetical protein [Termitinemataceae bacterium]
MRTTLTLDDGLDKMLRHIATQQHKSYKEVVNEALRRGVELLAENPPKGSYQVEPVVEGFQEGLDLNKLNHLVDELETDL